MASDEPASAFVRRASKRHPGRHYFHSRRTGACLWDEDFARLYPHAAHRLQEDQRPGCSKALNPQPSTSGTSKASGSLSKSSKKAEPGTFEISKPQASAKPEKKCHEASQPGPSQPRSGVKRKRRRSKEMEATTSAAHQPPHSQPRALPSFSFKAQAESPSAPIRFGALPSGATRMDTAEFVPMRKGRASATRDADGRAAEVEAEAMEVDEVAEEIRQLRSSDAQPRPTSGDASSDGAGLSSASLAQPGPCVVLDTNVLIHSLAALQRFLASAQGLAVVPWTVLQELDGLKSRPAVGPRARAATAALLGLRREIGGRLRFQSPTENRDWSRELDAHAPDDRILACARGVAELRKRSGASELAPTRLLTGDANLRLKAAAVGLAAARGFGYDGTVQASASPLQSASSPFAKSATPHSVSFGLSPGPSPSPSSAALLHDSPAPKHLRTRSPGQAHLAPTTLAVVHACLAAVVRAEWQHVYGDDYPLKEDQIKDLPGLLGLLKRSWIGFAGTSFRYPRGTQAKLAGWLQRLREGTGEDAAELAEDIVRTLIEPITAKGEGCEAAVSAAKGFVTRLSRQ